jgi:hypothetical protein
LTGPARIAPSTDDAYKAVVRHCEQSEWGYAPGGEKNGTVGAVPARAAFLSDFLLFDVVLYDVVLSSVLPSSVLLIYVFLSDILVFDIVPGLIGTASRVRRRRGM